MKKLLTLLLAVLMISAVIFITSCENKHTELPETTTKNEQSATTVNSTSSMSSTSSTSNECPPETTTSDKENIEITEPVVKERHENGNIKKAVYYRKDGTVSSEYEYNENGYIISETLYDTDGKKAKYRAYLGTGVEDDSTLTEEIRYRLDGKKTYHHKYEYDSNGRLIKDTTIPGSSTTYEYDKNGILFRRNTISSDGALKEYCLIEYTDAGRRERRVSHSGAALGITEYSKENVIVSALVYSSTGYTISLYDTDGKKTKETNYDRRGAEVSYTLYEYNENGFKTFARRYKAGVLDYILEYPGKKNGENYIKKTEYSPDGSVRKVYYHS